MIYSGARQHTLAHKPAPKVAILHYDTITRGIDSTQDNIIRRYNGISPADRESASIKKITVPSETTRAVLESSFALQCNMYIRHVYAGNPKLTNTCQNILGESSAPVQFYKTSTDKTSVYGWT